MSDKDKIYKLFGHSSDDKKKDPNLLISFFYPDKNKYFEEYTHNTSNNNARKDFINKIPDIDNKCIISLRGNGSCVINALYLYFVLSGIEPLGLIENNNKTIQKLNTIVIDGMNKYYEKNKDLMIEVLLENYLQAKKDVLNGNSPETPFVIIGIMEKFDLNITEYSIRETGNTRNPYPNPRNVNFPTLEYINSEGHAVLIFPKILLSKFLEDTDPTNYSRYSNSDNSCFFAGLWAFMHKLSNPVIELLNKKPYPSNPLSTYIFQYYNIIHSKTKTEDFKKFLKRFRDYLTKQEIEKALEKNKNKKEEEKDYIPFNWSNQQMDSGELIIRLFQEYTSNYNIKPEFSEDENQIFTLDPLNLINKKYTLDYWYNEDNSFFGIKTESANYNSILNESILTGFQLKLGDEIKFNNERNEIIIESPLEEFNDVEEISLTNELTNGKKKYKKKVKEIISKPEFFYIYLNRNRNRISSESGKNIKDKSSYPITESYGSMGLYSIVVHEGSSSSSSGGHYVCYFRNGPNWYKFNDSGAKISKVTSIHIKTIEQNWVLLVYFKNQIPQDDILKVLYSKETGDHTDVEKAANKIGKKYEFKPISKSILISLIGWIIYSEINKDNNNDNNDEKDEMIIIIGLIAMFVSELVSPDEPIKDTVTKFINYISEILYPKPESNAEGGFKNPYIQNQYGGFDFISSVQQLIYHVTEILTAWVNSNKSIPIKQIIEEYKSIILNPTVILVKQMVLASTSKSITMGIDLANKYINDSNYKIFIKADPIQQIKILRGLGWKVIIGSNGLTKLINWDTWITIGPSELIKIKKSKPNPIVKYIIQIYISNINQSYSNLLLQSKIK